MRHKAYLLSVGWIMVLWTAAAHAEIQFHEVTGDAGIAHAGPTYGASWGDLNGDGWPDIWVGNHRLDRNVPTLYLNQKDGRFKDITSEVVSVDPRADLHGAAWADFDNDGDQDLLATAGGGGGLDEIESASDTHLFVNDKGILHNEARRYGVLDPQGRGRTALWLDADKDGRLDILFSNHPRKDGKAPTSIYRQGPNGFYPANEAFNFLPSPLSGKEKVLDLIDNVRHLRPKLARSRLDAKEFAQLADLNGDGEAELLAYLGPLRIFSMDAGSFSDITNSFNMPNVAGIRDVAIEDFTGDLKPDIYLARSSHESDLIQSGEQELKGHMNHPLTVRFRSEGDVAFTLYPPWINPVIPDSEKPKLFIGQSAEVMSPPVSVTLSPKDTRLLESDNHPAKGDKGVAINYDSRSQTWSLVSSISEMNFVIRSQAPLREVQPVGFAPSKGELADVLLINEDNASFRAQSADKFPAGKTACDSVAAGDFDNDMDMDIYLSCTGPVANLPNVLLENSGDGRFSVAQNAGGAAGSDMGRGDTVVLADYDLDGFLDIFLTNGANLEPFSDDGPYQLFRNRGNSNHWIEIDLEGETSNRDGIGAIVFVDAGGIKQMRVQGGGMHAHAQNNKRIHFGLGKNTKVDKIVVRWPNGTAQELGNVDADRVLSVREAKSALPQDGQP